MSGVSSALPRSSDPAELRRCVTELAVGLDRSLQTHMGWADRVGKLEQLQETTAAQLATLTGIVTRIEQAAVAERQSRRRLWAGLVGAATLLQIGAGGLLWLLAHH